MNLLIKNNISKIEDFYFYKLKHVNNNLLLYFRSHVYLCYVNKKRKINMNTYLNEFELLDILKLLVPEGTNQGLSDGNKSISVKNENGNIIIECITKKEDNNTFDDSKIKSLVSEFKERINELDDCLFMEILEDLKTKLDIKELDSFLELKSFDKDTADKLMGMIDIATDIIFNHLTSKIDGLVKLYNRF